jgi:hypothetical protein
VKREFFLLNELIASQKKQLFSVASRIVPNVTEDDLLQPNDFPQLEKHPEFRYEEGVLHGFLATAAALSRVEED